MNILMTHWAQLATRTEHLVRQMENVVHTAFQSAHNTFHVDMDYPEYGGIDTKAACELFETAIKYRQYLDPVWCCGIYWGYASALKQIISDPRYRVWLDQFPPTPAMTAAISAFTAANAKYDHLDLACRSVLFMASEEQPEESKEPEQTRVFYEARQTVRDTANIYSFN